MTAARDRAGAAPPVGSPVGSPVGLPVALWAVPVSDVGGVARHVLDVVGAGVPGWRVVVLAPPGPLVERILARSGEVMEAPFGPDAGLRRSARALRQAVAAVRPAVVHTHLAHADLVAAVATMGRAGAGLALVSTEHGIAADDLVYHGTRAKAGVMAAAHALRLRRTDAVICVSQATREAMRDKWRPGRRTRLVVVRNGVDPPDSGDAGGGGRGPGVRIGAMARLAEEKGLDALLDAFVAVREHEPTAILRIAGVGPLEERLRARIGSLGLEGAASLCGFCEPAPFLATVDVVAQLSVWENCSYTLLDAVAAGLGVVATDVGGNPEILPARCLVPRRAPAASVAERIVAQGTDLSVRPTLPPDWPTVTVMTGQIADVYDGLGAAAPPARGSRRIDFVANNAAVGGGEVMLVRMAVAAREAGCDVRVVGPTFADGLARAAADAGLAFVGIPGADRRAYGIGLARMAWRRMASAARGSGSGPEREPGLGSGPLVWCNGLAPALATRLYRGRRVVHLHQLPSPRQARVLRLARRRSDVVVAPSAFLSARVAADAVLENWTDEPGAPDGDGPDGHRPDGLGPDGDGPVGRFRVGFMGRLSPIKGAVVLARAMAVLEARDPDRFALVVAGDDRLVPPAEAAAVRRELAVLARAGGVVDELGWVPPERFFGGVDVVVVPSLAEEAFGLVAAEAMAWGVPLIVSDAGALPEVVGAAHPGVVARGDAEALAAAIAASADDPVLARRRAREARLRWEERYAPAAGVARFERFLRAQGVLD